MNYELLGQSEPLTPEAQAVADTFSQGGLIIRKDGEAVEQSGGISKSSYIPRRLRIDELAEVSGKDNAITGLKLGKKTFSAFGTVKQDFSDSMAVDKLILYQADGRLPRISNMLENFWLMSTWSGQAAHWYAFQRAVAPPCRPEDYFATLDVITDPWEYIQFLSAWIPAGLCLYTLPIPYTQGSIHDIPKAYRINAYHTSGNIFSAYHDVENRVTSIQSNVPLLAPPKRVAEHRATYSQYILRWREVILSDIMKEVQQALNLTRQEDLPALELALSSLENRVNRLRSGVGLGPTGIPFEISTPYNFKLIVEEAYEWATMNNKKGSRTPDYFTYSLASAIPHKERADVPTVTMENGQTVTCQEALAIIWHESVAILDANLVQLAARVAELKDETKILQRNLDPATNYFLVPDLALTKKSGKPVYANVAANLTQGYTTGGRYVIDRPDLPSAKALLESIAVRDSAARNIRTDAGGRMSKDDLIRAGFGEEKPGLAPWLLGAAAGGLALFAFTR